MENRGWFQRAEAGTWQCRNANQKPSVGDQPLEFLHDGRFTHMDHADHLEKAPTRRHAVNGRGYFAFSDVRRLISKEATDDKFSGLCPAPRKSMVNSIVTMLPKMAA
jgi:hypothetical protein